MEISVPTHIGLTPDDTVDMTSSVIDPERLAELSRALWQLRRLLDRLRYQLTVQDLLLGSDDDDSLRLAVDDVHATIEAISVHELERVDLVANIGETMGLGHRASLQELIDNAPAPYDEILRDHRDRFLTISTEIASMSAAGHDRIERGVDLTRKMISFVAGDAGDGGYDSSGFAVPGTVQRKLLDESL